MLDQPIDTLSKGYKRRVGLAQALLHEPDVLILDEPTDGLDPNQKHQVRLLIRSLAEKTSIIVSTHILEEVDAVCTRAMVIAHGRILVDGTPRELEARSRYHQALYIRAVDALPQPVFDDLAASDEVAAVETSERPGDDGFYVFPRAGSDPAAVVRDILARHGAVISELRIERGRLEGVFREITQTAP